MIDHGNNLAVTHALIKKAAIEVEHARAEEVGTCGYRHHVDIGLLDSLLAIATAISVTGAIMHEQLELTKMIQMVVVHPKKEETDGNAGS